jgi:NADH:ubiquinone oxidoreductase subunit 3 (subunit A)
VRFVEHHAAVLAIPAVLPALIVVGVVVMIAVRDRRDQRRKAESGEDSE